MVDQAADAIVVAEVISQQRQEGERPRIVYELQVEEVLKGQVYENQLTIVVGPIRADTPPPEMLPDPGTRIFVLLGGTEGEWSLAADLNAVAIMEGNRVASLFRGHRVGIDDETWTPEDYVAVYQAHYEARTQMDQADGENQYEPTKNDTAPVSWWEKLLRWLGSLLP